MKTIPVVLVAAGLALAGSMGVAQAASLNAAWVEKDVGCWLQDGYGNLVPTDESITISTNGDTITLKCHAKNVPTPGVTVQYRDFPCGVWLGEDVPPAYTTDTFETVSASGNATMTCQVKRPK